MSIMLEHQASGKDLVESVVEEELFCLIEQIILHNEKPEAKILASQGIQSVTDKIRRMSIHANTEPPFK